jgi:hypothetical protein
MAKQGNTSLSMLLALSEDGIKPLLSREDYRYLIVEIVKSLATTERKKAREALQGGRA